MRWRLTSLLMAALLASRADGSSQTLTVAAASDLQAVLPGLVAGFEAESGLTVRVTFGSSGNFFAQIQNGAPFDVFLSADVEYPRLLASRGKADAATLYTYALGQLVVWTRVRSGLDLRRGLAVLADPTVTRVAIANPAHAPYGRAALAALDSAGITAQVRPKLVLGENASQTAQFVQSGNAQAGLLPRSLALSPALARSGHFVPVPGHLHPPIVQAAVVVSASKQHAAAARFLAFLKRDATAAHLVQAGFLRP